MKDFEQRKEAAINLIANKEFRAKPNILYIFTEQQIREQFEFDDMHQIFDKYDDMFTDANFIIYPFSKVILV